MTARKVIASAIVAVVLSFTPPADAGGGAVPDHVLAGTDVGQLADFATVPVAADLAGSYVADTGGASQSVELTRRPDGTWTVERSLTEPGEPPFVRTYEAFEDGGVLRSPAGDMELRAVADGVLLLETADDIVAPDMWTFYPRK